MPTSTPGSTNTPGSGINTSSLAGLADAAASHDLSNNSNNNDNINNNDNDNNNNSNNSNNYNNSGPTNNAQRSNNPQQPTPIVNLNDPNTWLYNLRPSRHNFQSMAVNMEYSIISNIINNTPYGSDLGSVSVVPSNAATGVPGPPQHTPHHFLALVMIHHPWVNKTMIFMVPQPIQVVPVAPVVTLELEGLLMVIIIAMEIPTVMVGSSNGGGGSYSFNPQTSGFPSKQS